jgi:cytochrome P450
MYEDNYFRNMQPAIFLQSEVQDPYAIYANFLKENPVYWDDANQLWAIWSYDQCKAILTHPAAQIPAINTTGLNDYAHTIISNLARLSNGIAERETAMQLFQAMRPVSVAEILAQLLTDKKEIDWVETVCKKLPVLTILKSFGFKEDDCSFILTHIASLTKIMLPVKTAGQLAAINTCSKEIYTLIAQHLKNPSVAAISNLAGLLIQSFDAGRGTLSNTLLHSFQQDYHNVTETLRFDSPIHNTRRIAAEDINQHIKKGQSILLVLAAANRDELQFADAGTYNSNRSNNHELLTFGLGAHACIAKQLSVNMATAALEYLFTVYPDIKLLQKDIEYEPLVNARLCKQLLISLQ